MPVFSKPSVPQPEWGHYLWRKCLFAAPHGWQRGHDASTKETTRDDANKVRGEIDGSVPGTIVFDLPGWSAASGNSLDLQKWADSSFYDFPHAGMSMFTLFRMLNDEGNNAYVFGRGTGLGAGSQGWGLRSGQLAGAYIFRLSDGATLDGIGVGSYTEPDTWKGIGVTMSVDLDVVGYFNAARTGSGVAVNPANTCNPNDTVKIFGDDTGNNDQIDGQMSMSAFWSIELSQKMMADLAVDPFVMWKAQHVDVHLGDIIAFADGYQTYLGAF